MNNKEREPIRSAVAAVELTASMKAQRKRDLISAAIHKNLAQVLEGTYTIANLCKEAGFRDEKSLRNFLRIHFMTTVIGNIARVIQKNESGL